ncbi:MAG: PorT family protein [Bacteroidaceae bacterium]|nr:PorT family protein [Bacteroidaceae bacterium]
MNIRNLILLLTALIVPCCIKAEEQEKRMKFNYGAKAGFQAIAYNNPVFEIDGYEFDSNTLHSNKIGYTIAPFVRLTRNRVYVQSECVFGIARHSFDFNSTSDEENIIPNEITYNLRTICLQVPIVFGYNIINDKKYVMSLFTGPKTKFVFTSHSKQEFEHFEYYDLEEVLKKRCYYWEIGLGVKIGHVFFDFVYDWGITKASEYIVSEIESRKFRSDRRDNILSFSVGMIF